jgi:hypothetical protein
VFSPENNNDPFGNYRLDEERETGKYDRNVECSEESKLVVGLHPNPIRIARFLFDRSSIFVFGFGSSCFV